MTQRVHFKNIQLSILTDNTRCAFNIVNSHCFLLVQALQINLLSSSRISRSVYIDRQNSSPLPLTFCCDIKWWWFKPLILRYSWKWILLCVVRCLCCTGFSSSLSLYCVNWSCCFICWDATSEFSCNLLVTWCWLELGSR